VCLPTVVVAITAVLVAFRAVPHLAERSAARGKPRQEPFDRRMFVARVLGESMEPGVPGGSWAIFRAAVVLDDAVPAAALPRGSARVRR
jgi:hypothetical protein